MIVVFAFDINFIIIVNFNLFVILVLILFKSIMIVNRCHPYLIVPSLELRYLQSVFGHCCLGIIIMISNTDIICIITILILIVNRCH